MSEEGYNLQKKCKCKEKDQEPTLINYSMIWHDGDIVCDNCRCFIRDYDAG